jgi:hypothetical protein
MTAAAGTTTITAQGTVDSRPWYREPWPWIVMAGPAIVIVAGVITAWIAFAGADGLVSDDYYKQGLAINRVIARGEAAAQRGLAGELAIGASGELRVRLEQRADQTPLPAAVRVRLVHPTRASEDRVVEALRSEAGDYRAQVDRPAGLQWHAVVDTSEWRLEGSLPADGGAARLAAK